MHAAALPGRQPDDPTRTRPGDMRGQHGKEEEEEEGVMSPKLNPSCSAWDPAWEQCDGDLGSRKHTPAAPTARPTALHSLLATGSQLGQRAGHLAALCALQLAALTRQALTRHEETGARAGELGLGRRLRKGWGRLIGPRRAAQAACTVEEEEGDGKPLLSAQCVVIR